jgi:thiamine biosynthesis lipoprotein
MLQKFSYTQPKMGSPFTIIFFAPDEKFANELAATCFELTDRFNMIFSDYDAGSELSRLCAAAGNGWQDVSPSMMELFLKAAKAWQQSKATYDITAGALTKCWRQARKEKRLPDEHLVQEKLSLTGFDKILINATTRQINLPLKGMEIDFGGIAKGYIAHQVLQLLSRSGISNALVDAGGDMVMSGPPPGKQGWIVGVTIPEHTSLLLPRKLSLSNTAIATSGDAYQYIVHNGKKYSHIIDPRTGYAITEQRNVTVVTADAVLADWLATACSILPINEARELTEHLGACFLITELKQGKIIAHTAGRFSDHWHHS